MGSSIYTPVYATVILGGTSPSAYASPLTIGPDPFGGFGGKVDPSAYGATGIYSDTLGVELTNHGRVFGGGGSKSLIPGGTAVDLTAPATVINYGHFNGGSANQDTAGGSGGVGLYLSGGTATN